MEIKYWAGTDIGRKRSDNEDNYLVARDLNLFLVADGMGGHASGEVASAIAVHTVHEVLAAEADIFDRYDDGDPRSHIEVCTLLEYAVHQACSRIFDKAEREPEKKGMGTTMVALLLHANRGFIAYVGDSRIYLSRGGMVHQLTEDHSVLNELVRQGRMTADEFDESPYAKLKHTMTRAVGVFESVEVDTLDFDVIPGDAFLLCSDGLYEYLEETDIANSLALSEVESIPGQLIELANRRGGKDNITAVVIQVQSDEGDGARAAEANFTLDTLKRVPLFSQLSYQHVVRVMNLAKQRPFRSGQVLCRENDLGYEFFVILRGEVSLTKNDALITKLGSGDHFGEMALIDASPRSATATALSDGKVLTISRLDFYEILRKDAPLAVKLLWSLIRVVTQRLRQTTADLSEARKVADVIPDMTDDLFES